MLKRIAMVATAAVIAGTLMAGSAEAYSTFKTGFKVSDLAGSGFHASTLLNKKGKGYSSWINKRGEVVVRVATWFARKNPNAVINIGVRGNGGKIKTQHFAIYTSPGGGFSVSPT